MTRPRPTVKIDNDCPKLLKGNGIKLSTECLFRPVVCRLKGTDRLYTADECRYCFRKKNVLRSNKSMAQLNSLNRGKPLTFNTTRPKLYAEG